MLKRLMFAVALMFAFNASADSFFLSAKAKPGNTCAWFQGGFTTDGYQRPMNEGRPVVVCKLVEHVGANCLIQNHGISGMPPALSLSGRFGDIDNTLVVHTVDGSVNAKLYCTTERGCYLFQFYDSDDRIGYACDMINWTPPAPPAPKPPPLLRKPDDSNKPVPPKPESFSV